MRLFWIGLLALGACAAPQGGADQYDGQQTTAADAVSYADLPSNQFGGSAIPACDPIFTEPHMVLKCLTEKQRLPKLSAKQREELAADRAKVEADMAASTAATIAEAQRSEAERQARAQCVYQAQVANVTTPGLISGLAAGIGAGQACTNYYRTIGVIR